MYERNSHCSYCGTAFAAGQPWPRSCANCGKRSYVNPMPVAVTLVPVDGGLLVVRRAIQPRQGMLALPGGFINLGESWQQAGAREVFEETGLRLSPDEIGEFAVRSAPDSTLLVFGLAQPRGAAELPPLLANAEVSERLVIIEPTELAFSLHTEATNLFFARQAASVAS